MFNGEINRNIRRTFLFAIIMYYHCAERYGGRFMILLWDVGI